MISSHVVVGLRQRRKIATQSLIRLREIPPSCFIYVSEPVSDGEHHVARLAAMLGRGILHDDLHILRDGSDQIRIGAIRRFDAYAGSLEGGSFLACNSGSDALTACRWVDIEF